VPSTFVEKIEQSGTPSTEDALRHEVVLDNDNQLNASMPAPAFEEESIMGAAAIDPSATNTAPTPTTETATDEYQTMMRLLSANNVAEIAPEIKSVSDNVAVEVSGNVVVEVTSEINHIGIVAAAADGAVEMNVAAEIAPEINPIGNVVATAVPVNVVPEDVPGSTLVSVSAAAGVSGDVRVEGGPKNISKSISGNVPVEAAGDVGGDAPPEYTRSDPALLATGTEVAPAPIAVREEMIAYAEMLQQPSNSTNVLYADLEHLAAQPNVQPESAVLVTSHTIGGDAATKEESRDDADATAAALTFMADAKTGEQPNGVPAAAAAVHKYKNVPGAKCARGEASGGRVCKNRPVGGGVFCKGHSCQHPGGCSNSKSSSEDACTDHKQQPPVAALEMTARAEPIDNDETSLAADAALAQSSANDAAVYSTCDNALAGTPTISSGDADVYSTCDDSLVPASINTSNSGDADIYSTCDESLTNTPGDGGAEPSGAIAYSTPTNNGAVYAVAQLDGSEQEPEQAAPAVASGQALLNSSTTTGDACSAPATSSNTEGSVAAVAAAAGGGYHTPHMFGDNDAPYEAIDDADATVTALSFIAGAKTVNQSNDSPAGALAVYENVPVLANGVTVGINEASFDAAAPLSQSDQQVTNAFEVVPGWTTGLYGVPVVDTHNPVGAAPPVGDTTALAQPATPTPADQQVTNSFGVVIADNAPPVGAANNLAGAAPFRTRLTTLELNAPGESSADGDVAVKGATLGESSTDEPAAASC
jgi:hypothetical protein